MAEEPEISDKKLLNVIRQLRMYGPTTTESQRPCLYDIRSLLGMKISAKSCNDLAKQVQRLVDAGEIVQVRTPGSRRFDPAEYDLSDPTMTPLERFISNMGRTPP